MKFCMNSSLDLSSDGGASSGCIAGVLRRILCRSLRGHGCRDEEDMCGFGTEQVRRRKKKSATAATVGSSHGVAESVPAATIFRSRSANSLETGRAAEMLEEQRSCHGGALLRSCQSFREVPTFLRKESEEFLVLSFGNDDEAEELKLELKELRRAERKQGEKTTMSRNTNRETEIQSSVLEEMKLELSSQNSSPVSVLDLHIDADGECLASPDSPSADLGKRTEEEKSRTDQRRPRSGEAEGKKTRKWVGEDGGYSALWANICGITERDLNESKWAMKKIINSGEEEEEEVEEIVCSVGQGILDLLLHEAVLHVFS
ncbi:hypothetical protein AXF42_Ash012277 [Apostasia shenzhenica]|uniref:DUF4378 domain-containing protein n=1 Tax=Apostasia shenzhenica TaxID=1088818 RepID=A0A2I0B4I5_9ASPA|nr:hypothetical protein AXF42_Ash012277 [Apostasia shenzhenica]